VTTDALARRLVDDLVRTGPVAVAFSGGADSALVLAAAVRGLGPGDVVAVTANSASLPAAELQAAQAFAATLNVRHLAPRTRELAVPGYAANGRDRCYFCKATVLSTIAEVAAELGIPRVATGTNADDAVDPFRPGIRAGDELAVSTPLRDLGMSKEDVRAVSALWRLPTAEKPASACLASRIRYGITITPARLARVERAEVGVRSVLGDLGIPAGQLRVRDLGDAARIELDSVVLPTLSGHPGLVAAVRAAGFDTVTFAPYRPGSLNHEGKDRP
jgi:uncharacterized protein